MKKNTRNALIQTLIATTIFFIGLLFVDVAIRHNGWQLSGNLFVAVIFGVINFFITRAVADTKSAKER